MRRMFGRDPVPQWDRPREEESRRSLFGADPTAV
jgi:hypothetical protein